MNVKPTGVVGETTSEISDMTDDREEYRGFGALRTQNLFKWMLFYHSAVQ